MRACDNIQSYGEAPWIQPGLALVFDMDGVIVDSNPVHRIAWTAYSRQFGVETDEAMLERMYGRRNDDIVRDFFGDSLSPAEIQAHGAAKERLYREMMAGALDEHLVRGVKDFLARHTECPLAMATNAEPANVRFLLENAGLASCFKVVVDGSQVLAPKPDPEIYLTAARKLGVSPRNCIVFEDSYSGVSAAKAAGMRTVGVRTTHADLPGVDLAVDDFGSTGLKPWLLAQTVAP